ALLEAELARAPGANAREADREALARRQAQAAVTLLHLGQTERVWPLLRHRPDPLLRTYLVHLLGSLGVEFSVLARRLAEEQDSARRALVLSLGQVPPQRRPARQQDAVADRLLESYREDPDPGMHAAAEWLLRRWGRGAALLGIDQELTSRLPLG